jgi:PIN domain
LKAAYLDSSFFLGIAFGENSSGSLARKLSLFDRLHSSNLLDAEVRSAFAREGLDEPEEALFESIVWTLPDRPLAAEFRSILAHGHQKGADLWHLACALYLSPDPREISFLTLDSRQKRAAAKLGFAI